MKISSGKFKILVCLAALSAAVMVLSFCFSGGEAEFTPPPFESSVVLGVPSVPDGLGYGEIWQEGMAYRFSVCGSIVSDGAKATVYLTNPAENDVWLKLRILDKNGNILGETGIIKPGEYVEKAALSRECEAGTEIVLKIMGYEPETYHSAGAVTLKTKISENPAKN